MAFYVYILASQRNGTLYTGHTDSLSRRVWEHKEGATQGFTTKYGVKTLVWYETFETRSGAFARERAIKKWNRAWKIQLIERSIRVGAIFSMIWMDKKPGSPLSRG